MNFTLPAALGRRPDPDMQRCITQHLSRDAVAQTGQEGPRGDFARVPDPHPAQGTAAPRDAQGFWQIHRSTVVRASAIDSVSRDDSGKLSLSLRGRPEKLPASRPYAHLFRAM